MFEKHNDQQGLSRCHLCLPVTALQYLLSKSDEGACHVDKCIFVPFGSVCILMIEGRNQWELAGTRGTLQARRTKEGT